MVTRTKLQNFNFFSCCRVRSEPDGTRWHTGREVKGKQTNGVGRQCSSTSTSEHGLSSITIAARWSALLDCQYSTELTPPPISMDSSASLKDQILFLHVCHHISNGLYHTLLLFDRSSPSYAVSPTTISINQISLHNSISQHTTILTQYCCWQMNCNATFRIWGLFFQWCRYTYWGFRLFIELEGNLVTPAKSRS
jgi:hypothetical protein